MLDLIGDRNLRDLLDEQVQRHPGKTWLVFEDRTDTVSEWTYAAFAERVDELATGLQDAGIGVGDRVTIHTRNCPEIIEVWFALATIGAVFVPSNVANTASELGHVVGWSESSLVVTQAEFVDLVQEAAAGCPGVQRVLVTGAEPIADAAALDDYRLTGKVPRRADVGPDDVVEMIFTSGTISRPKAVLLSHGIALNAGEQTARSLLLDESDRCLTSLPIFHVNAQSMTVLGALTVGGTCIVLEEYRATRYWDQIRAHRATQTSLVAMLARTLLAQEPRHTDTDHHLRRVFFALNITEEERDAFERRFGVELINGYGLSEAMTLVTIAPVYGPKRWPSIGKPLHDRVVRLVGPEGNDVPQGEVGEIVVKGRPGHTLMLGYHRDPPATAEALRDGWLHTGDNAYADERGYLYFFDRRKDMIKRAGENISTLEVEATLLDHPEIAEAAVVGVPDPIRDEAVKACVVLSPGSTLTTDDIQSHCRSNLASFKIPTIIELLTELPKTSIGKIEKKQLRG